MERNVIFEGAFVGALHAHKSDDAVLMQAFWWEWYPTLGRGRASCAGGIERLVLCATPTETAATALECLNSVNPNCAPLKCCSPRFINLKLY